MTPRAVRRPVPPAALALACAVALAGCISVLPREKPSQLYRLSAGAATVEVPPTAAGEARIGLVLSPVDLPRAAAGDRILTVTGEQAAYISGARWVSPAAVLVGEAVEEGFAARSRAVRLYSRAESGAAQASLRLDAPVFETRYPAPGSAPTVHVTLRALLLHKTGAFAAAQEFAAEAPASENGVHAIVGAYDEALGRAVAALVAWTDANAALAASPSPIPTPAYVTRMSTTTTQTREGGPR